MVTRVPPHSSWLKAWAVLATPPPLGKGPEPLGLVIGDLILCSPISPNAKQAVIIQAQSKVYAPPDACFTHVAIYAGSGMAFDSAPRTGVSLRPFQDVTAGAHIRARRLKGITPTIQFDIYSAAAAYGGGYGYLNAFIHGLIATLQGTMPPQWVQLLAMLTNGQPMGAPSTADPLHCSQFVQAVYLQAANSSVLQGRNLVPLPAAFSDVVSFDEVPISW